MRERIRDMACQNSALQSAFCRSGEEIIKQRKDHITPKRPGPREVRGKATRVRFQRQRGMEEAERKEIDKPYPLSLRSMT